jgi:transposase-like protein
VDRPFEEKGGVTFRVNQHTLPVFAGRKETPPMLRVVEKPDTREEGEEKQDLDELAREGARRMLMTALEAEVAWYVEAHEQERDEGGLALVVRNGKARVRRVTLGVGTIEVRAPRVNDRRVDEQGGRQRFTSEILPPYMRRSPKVAEVLPILYLRGLSTGDFRPALEGLLGKNAAGLSATNITRLTAEWDEEYQLFRKSSLAEKDYVYVWVDGIHFNVRLEDDRLCTLVMIGTRPDGTKELIAVEDGYRESTESWASLLRELKRRGMRAPLVAVGDGALGFWAAVGDVWPETRHARDWCHKLGNVLDKLPKRLQPRAKALLREAMYADTREHAREALGHFAEEYEAKYPKAVECLRADEEPLLMHFDFPAEHWKHLRTSNVIESPFATVRLRQRVTKGAGSRSKALLMAFKLLDMAQQRWRKLNGAELLPLVRAGVRFVDGVRQEREKKGTERKGKAA